MDLLKYEKHTVLLASSAGQLAWGQLPHYLHLASLV